jgi:DNA/RNA-binding domain of Phe-tRNA-synthetase-like protein
MASGTIEPPVVLRAGREGEAMESLRGPFDLAGKPLLADARGPFGTPITDSVRVKVLPETTEAWCVAYLPAGVVSPATAERALLRLAGDSGIDVGVRFTVA